MSFVSLLAVALIVLKLTHVIAWPWIVVLLPVLFDLFIVVLSVIISVWETRR